MSTDAITVIEATPPGLGARARALWRYRGFYGFLFTELMMRKARGTVLGFWWLILRPLIPALALLFTFSMLAPVDSGSAVPYPVFFLSGFLTWRLFQATVSFLPRSLMWMRGVMRRTYFPRLLVPLAGLGPPLIEFGIICLLFLAVVGKEVIGGDPMPLQLGWVTLLLVPCLVASLAFALSLGMVFSVVALFFRDVIYSIGYAFSVMMFLTPVVYPLAMVPEPYRTILLIVNPMVMLVETSRVALTGQGFFSWPLLLTSWALVGVIAAACLTFFLRAESMLADEL